MSDQLNRVVFTTDTIGTGSVIHVLAAASNAFFTPGEAGIVDGHKYTLLIQKGSDFEIQQDQTWTTSTSQFTRGTPVASKIAGVAGTTKISLDNTCTITLGASALDLMFGQTRAADLASAATLDMQSVQGGIVNLTGITGITAVTLNDGQERWALYTGAGLTITVSSTLIGNGNGSNVTLATGDLVIFQGFAAGVVRFFVIRATGAPVVETATGAALRTAANAAAGRTAIGAGAVDTAAITTSITVTGTAAATLAVGANGATNPVLQVDASAVSVATGLKLTGAAAAAGAALAVISSGVNENLAIDAKGTGTLTLNGTATGNVTTPRPLTITNAAASTSTSTGALIVTGGVGVGGALNVGGAINASGAIAFTNASITLGTVSQATTLVINGGSTGATSGIVIQANGTNEIFIGSENFVTSAGSISKLTFYSATSTFRFFGLGPGTMTTDASGNVSISSDANLKIDLNKPFARTINDLIDADGNFIAAPKTFRWRPDSGMDGGEYVGFFAQEYEEGSPEAIGRTSDGMRTFSDRVAIALLHNTAYDHEMRLRALEGRLTQ